MTDPLQIQADLEADPSLFPAIFDDPTARKWFIKKMVVHASTAADRAAKSREYLEKAKTIVTARPDVPRPYVRPGSYMEVETLVARVMYGSMGAHPAVFLDQDNSALLRFVVERRVRTVLQMSDHVNSRRRYFLFPRIDVWHSSLRSSAQGWQGTRGAQNEFWPFVLSAAGTNDPETAVAGLFNTVAPANDQDVHGVECQTAAAMVLLDSLLAAANPDALFTSLASGGDGYLAIDNPDVAMRKYAVEDGPTGKPLGGFHVLAEQAVTGSNVLKVVPPLNDEPTVVKLAASDGIVQTVPVRDMIPPSEPIKLINTSAAPLSPSELGLDQQLTRAFDRGTRVLGTKVPEYHFLSDARPQTALFEQGFVSLDDLQPGDVVHVLGHPLIRAKIPTSAFGGERCVVVNPWKSVTYLISVSGHGVGVTSLFGLTEGMLRLANRLLTVSRRVLEHCLNPALTLFPAASGVIPVADRSDVAATQLETRIMETIGRALGFGAAEWSAPDFFTGTWKVYNFSAIQPAAVPWWDQLAGFSRGYPKHWALSAVGTVRPGYENEVTLMPNSFFAFGYWPDAAGDLNWPIEIDKNYVGLLWGFGDNLGAADEKRQFAIPYTDDQAGHGVYMPLYTKGPANAAAEPTILTYDDLLPQLFSLAKDDTEAWVIRPRVSSDAAYLTHLRSIGALPMAP